MNTMDMRFLEALRASLEGRTLRWNDTISQQEWQQLYHQAEIQNVLPLIFETVYSCPAKQSITQEQQKLYRRKTMQDIMLQTMRTEKFMEIAAALYAAGVTPLIVKGIICRSLYPMPDHRPSSDEDFLVREDEFLRCHQILLEQGMSLLNPEADYRNALEVSYGMKDAPLHIAVHKQLFTPGEVASAEMNCFFQGVWEREIALPINGVLLHTMGPTDQLLYLIYHALKHFLHSGFGLRQVCDITLFANQYGGEIDWARVLACCRTIHADHFAATLFRIGRSYLTFRPKQAQYPKVWRELEVDETLMLEDLFASGVLGGRSMSAAIATPRKIVPQKAGKQNRLLHNVFPRVKELKEQYPYLERKPQLFPLAWANRIAASFREMKTTQESRPEKMRETADTWSILMKQYGIIE